MIIMLSLSLKHTHTLTLYVPFHTVSISLLLLNQRDANNHNNHMDGVLAGELGAGIRVDG